MTMRMMTRMMKRRSQKRRDLRNQPSLAEVQQRGALPTLGVVLVPLLLVVVLLVVVLVVVVRHRV